MRAAVWLAAAALQAQDAPRFELDQYQFGLMKRGPSWSGEVTEESKKIQAGHMANLRRMSRLGRLMAAGPLLDNGDVRGILIFKASEEEAKSLVAEDPAVKAGRLAVELMPWTATKGIGAGVEELLKKNPEMAFTMTRYFLVLLEKGAQWSGENTAENQKLQGEHLRYIRRMLDAKTDAAAGPLGANAPWRGVLVIAAPTPEEARKAADADPMVRAGHLTVDLRPWLVAREVWP